MMTLDELIDLLQAIRNERGENILVYREDDEFGFREVLTVKYCPNYDGFWRIKGIKHVMIE